MLMDPAGKEMKIDWKAVKPNEVELKLPLQDAKPGAATLLVSEYGASQPQSMPLQIFADAGHRDQFWVHAGDAAGILKGSRLDEVDSLTLKGVRFVPERPTPGGAATSCRGGRRCILDFRVAGRRRGNGTDYPEGRAGFRREVAGDRAAPRSR